MNLRDIKKEFSYGVGAFVDDCALFLDHASDKGGKVVDTVNALVDEAIAAYNETLCDMSNAPEKGKRTFYNGIRKAFSGRIDAMYEKLSAAVKENLGK